jgi:hypothetical protein
MKQFALLALLGFASAVRQEATTSTDEPDYSDPVDQATLDSLQSIDLSAFDEPTTTT